MIPFSYFQDGVKIAINVYISPVALPGFMLPAGKVRVSTGWKVRRLALFYDSEGKREKSTIKAANSAALLVFYSYKLSIF